MPMSCRQTSIANFLPQQPEQALRQMVQALLVLGSLLAINSLCDFVTSASAREFFSRPANYTQSKIAAPLNQPSAATLQTNTFGLKPMSQLSINIAAPVAKADLPSDVAASHFERENRLAAAMGVGRYWPLTNYQWDASMLYHEPLLFEELNVERYGISYGWCQPIVSGAHFFITVPALPYKTWAQGHDCQQYSLGYYRPGSCATPQRYKRRLRPDAGLFQAGIILGMIYILP